MAWQKRIQNDVKNIIQFPIDSTETPLSGLHIFQDPYEGAVFDIECRISKLYPFRAPFICFLTPIYHINIHESGTPYCPLIVDTWSPSNTLQTILLYLEELLLHPNPTMGYNYDAGQLFQQDPEAYWTTASTYTKTIMNVWSKKRDMESTIHR